MESDTSITSKSASTCSVVFGKALGKDENLLIYTLGKGCYAPIWGNKIDMDRIVVLSVDWNWHEMYPWLLPNEIWPYLGWTFTSMPRGIVEVQTLQLRCAFSQIYLCTVASSNQQLYIFSQFTLIVLIMRRPTLTGIGHEVLALAH